jgi:hypothetical protein
MSFCRICGASVEGDLCPKCGALMGSGQMPPVPKKNRALYWVLGGCLGLILIVILVVVGSGLYFVHKVGFDPALAAKSPAHAAAKVMTTLDPNIEIISIDESTGLIRMRDKKSGRIMRMNVKDGRKSRIISEEGMKEPPGANPHREDWLPLYWGRDSEAAFTYSLDRKSGSIVFQTVDSAETVALYYEDFFKNAGFTFKRSVVQIAGKGESIVIAAEDAKGKRNAHVTAERSKEFTKVTCQFENKD